MIEVDNKEPKVLENMLKQIDEARKSGDNRFLYSLYKLLGIPVPEQDMGLFNLGKVEVEKYGSNRDLRKIDINERYDINDLAYFLDLELKRGESTEGKISVTISNYDQGRGYPIKRSYDFKGIPVYQKAVDPETSKTKVKEAALSDARDSLSYLLKRKYIIETIGKISELEEKILIKPSDKLF